MKPNNLLVVNSVANINVSFIRHVKDGWVQVDDLGHRQKKALKQRTNIAWIRRLMQVGIDTLHECGLSRTSHS